MYVLYIFLFYLIYYIEASLIIILICGMKSAKIEIPTIDVEAYLKESEQGRVECLKVAECLHKYGILIIRDPRVNEEHNDSYLDLMEEYF